MPNTKLMWKRVPGLDCRCERKTASICPDPKKEFLAQSRKGAKTGSEMNPNLTRMKSEDRAPLLLSRHSSSVRLGAFARAQFYDQRSGSGGDGAAGGALARRLERTRYGADPVAACSGRRAHQRARPRPGGAPMKPCVAVRPSPRTSRARWRTIPPCTSRRSRSPAARAPW